MGRSRTLGVRRLPGQGNEAVVDQRPDTGILIAAVGHGLEAGNWAATIGDHDRLSLLNLSDQR